MSGKKYKIRTFMGKDIFKISKFIKKLGVNRLKEIFEDSKALETINIAMSGGRLYITDAEFLNSLQLSNFTFEPRTNGNLSFYKNRR